MRKWFLPLTVIGLTGLGMAVASDRGRGYLRRVFDTVINSQDAFGNLNTMVERELDNIQQALNDIADALGAPADSAN